MTRPMNAAWVEVNRLKKLLEFDLQRSVELNERKRHMTCSPLIFCIGAAPTLTISAGAGGRGWEEAALRSETV